MYKPIGIFYLAFTALLSCAPAKAQPLPPKVSQETINSVVQQLSSNICSESIILASESMHKCYDYINTNSPEIDQCILADMYIQYGMTHFRQRRQDLDLPSLTDNIPYINPENFQKRMKEYLNLPRFNSLKTLTEKENYFKSAVNEVEQHIFEECKIFDYKYSSGTKWKGQVKNPQELDTYGE